MWYVLCVSVSVCVVCECMWYVLCVSVSVCVVCECVCCV